MDLIFSRYLLPVQRRNSPHDQCQRGPTRYDREQCEPLPAGLRQEGQQRHRSHDQGKEAAVGGDERSSYDRIISMITYKMEVVIECVGA